MKHGGAGADACDVGVRDGKGKMQPEKLELAARLELAWGRRGVAPTLPKIAVLRLRDPQRSGILQGLNRWGRTINYGNAAGGMKLAPNGSRLLNGFGGEGGCRAVVQSESWASEE
jgi:hypothetical protein